MAPDSSPLLQHLSLPQPRCRQIPLLPWPPARYHVRSGSSAIRAIDLLKVASPIELGQTTQVQVYLCPAYLRGEAYLMFHDGNAAAAEFQKFIDHRGLVGNFAWGALARLGLARAHALNATKDSAARDQVRSAYQVFLTLWKEADPDIPILIAADSE